MCRVLFAGLLLLCVFGRASAQGMLDLVPEGAAIAVAIRDLDNLIEKGDKFLAKSELAVPLRPSDLFTMANNILGIQQGLNKKGSAAILLMGSDDPKLHPFDRLTELLVPILPFTDADAMAGNFGLKKGELARGKAVPVKKANQANDFTKFASRTDSHLYLSGSKKTLERIARSKSIAESVSAAQRKQLNDSDILVEFGHHLWANETDGLNRLINNWIKPGEEPEEKQFAERFAKGLREVRHVVTGFQVGDGLGLHTVGVFPKGGEGTKLLTELRGKRPSSTLKGLPEGNVLLAQAMSTDENQTALLARNIFHNVLEGLLIPNKVVAPIDRFAYLGVMHEVWRKLEGSRLAVYQNAHETKQGLFSIVAILDTKDAPQFLKELKTLAKMAEASSLDWTKKEVQEEIDIDRLIKNLGSDRYATRQSASTKLSLVGEPALPYLTKALASKTLDLETTRRAHDLRDRISDRAAQRRKELLDAKNQPLFVRPSLTFVPSAEKRARRTVDVVQIKTEGADQAATKKYQQLLGPDWDKLRLAIVGKQVVVLLGSDVDLFDAALSNIESGRAGLAESKRLAAFQKTQSKDRLVEFHVSVEGVMRLVTQRAERDKPFALTSLALTVEEATLQLDAWAPLSEVRTMVKSAGVMP